MKLFLMSTLLAFTLSAIADDKDKAKNDEMMKKWKEYSTPTETHKLLESMAGKWTYTQTMWHSKDSKPEESKGTAVFKMIMGGRYLQQEIKGKAMGEDFNGLGFTGYDNLKKQTNSVWMDNMGTSILSGTGSVDMATKTIAEKGEFTCPMEKDNTAEYRSDWVIVDKNTMTFTMYNKMEGAPEFKMMEMTYKRAK